MSGMSGEAEEQPANKRAREKISVSTGSVLEGGGAAKPIPGRKRWELTKQYNGDRYYYHENMVVADQRKEPSPSCCESDFCHCLYLFCRSMASCLFTPGLYPSEWTVCDGPLSTSRSYSTLLEAWR